MRLVLAAAVLLLAACGGQAPRKPGPAVPPRQAPVLDAGVPVAEANFQLRVEEVVLDAASDAESYTVAYIDGNEAGRTNAGLRVHIKKLNLKLPPGNRLLRMEHFVAGQPAPRQPRERFVRVEDGFVTRAYLRFPADGEPQLIVQREK